MNILFIDCETTGKPKVYNASYTDVDNWPRVTQLAWMLTDQDGNMINQHQALVLPDGWEIPKEQFFIDNDMSTERCQEHGRPILELLQLLMESKLQTDVLVAHNLSFDHRVIWAEFIRAGMTPRSGLEKICTMLKSTKHCNLPNPRGYGAPKWPKLEELHRILFKKDFEGAHDALSDVAAMKDCFFELVKIKVIALPEPKPTTTA